MKAFQYVVFAGLLCGMLACQGCATYLAYQSSAKELVRQRVYSSRDVSVIQMFEATGDVPAGYEPHAGEIIENRPGRVLVGLIVDSGVGYGIYRVIDDNIDKDDSKDDGGIDINMIGNDETIIQIIQGSGNDAKVTQEEEDEVVVEE